ncbi:MAG: histidine kinase dimerization/phospho-acceptor domain-containing protein [Brotaphodocola sp.]
MKWNLKSFGAKLWIWFMLFAAFIFMALWLLQIVFLQYFYDGMAIKNVKKVAAQIARQQKEPEFDQLLDSLAYENSLLIFVTDRQDGIVYGTDEHSHVYGRERQSREDNENKNPYRNSGEKWNWQIGAERNLSLPQDYDVFLQRLSDSKDGTVGYQLDNSSTYVYGMVLPSEEHDTIIYISTSLDAVGATELILRTELLWVTVASVLLAFAIAYLIARRFSHPVSILLEQARHMTEGDFQVCFEQGFCTELDELADTLKQTADELSRTEQFRREFLVNISHDLRTPLTMIDGYAEMIRDISGEDREQREMDLEIIIREERNPLCYGT